MEIESILENAQQGNLPECANCPWSPKKVGNIAFGVSCIEHGANWKQACNTKSMLIVQDPGDTTPQATGRLCAVHNARNPSDKSAQQGLDLWNTTVLLDSVAAGTDSYMKSHYWANAIMHGASGGSKYRTRNNLELARQSCKGVLMSQIIALKPRVLIGTGAAAVSSFYEIGLIKHKWKNLRHAFQNGAYEEIASNWQGIENDMEIFCTYHTSARVVNQTLSMLYNKKTEELIYNKSQKLPTRKSVNEFLIKYRDIENNARDRGMRYLLNHWLDIGTAIRRANKCEPTGAA